MEIDKKNQIFNFQSKKTSLEIIGADLAILRNKMALY